MALVKQTGAVDAGPSNNRHSASMPSVADKRWHIVVHAIAPVCISSSSKHARIPLYASELALHCILYLHHQQALMRVIAGGDGCLRLWCRAKSLASLKVALHSSIVKPVKLNRAIESMFHRQPSNRSRAFPSASRGFKQR